MVEITSSDLLTQENLRNPSAFFARVREQGPLVSIPDLNGMGETWIITNYEDALAVLKDVRFTKDMRKLWVSPLENEENAAQESISSENMFTGMHMLMVDEPDHTRLRRFVSKAFTPPMIEHFRPHIQQITDELLDAVEKQGAMDLMADFAFPLPNIVLSEMLGVPSTDHQKFAGWAHTIMSSIVDSQEMAASDAAQDAFTYYLKELLSTKREHPGYDLTSGRIQAEEQGDSLSEYEIMAMIFVLMLAGYTTTLNLIGTGTLALLQYPQQMQLLQQDPSLVPLAIEELLRYTAPLSFTTPRWALEDIALHDKVIRKGDGLFVSLSAVNTDPQQFTDPEVLDIIRQENKHLAFGKGIHVCLGAPLARLVGEIAIGTLLRRFPSLRLNCKPEELIWKSHFFTRSLSSLPVTFNEKVPDGENR